VREVFGVEMHALWGMTENGASHVTRPDDPGGWAAHSDGRSTAVDAGPHRRRTRRGSGRLLCVGLAVLGYLGQRTSTSLRGRRRLVHTATSPGTTAAAGNPDHGAAPT